MKYAEASDEWIMTTIPPLPGSSPWTAYSVVSHKRDLSDLGEPYLSAVKDARKPRKFPDGYVGEHYA